MSVIHAECTPDHRDLFLVAGGPVAELTESAKRLQLLTPLFKQTTPPGALTTRLTWAAVVQLAGAFGEQWSTGPTLTAWVADQVRARASSGDALGAGLVGVLDALPAGLKPYTWQTEGAAMIERLGRVLITDEPGTGKTMTTILGLRAWAAGRGSQTVVVICPASVIDAWVAAYGTWAPDLTAVAWRGPKRGLLVGAADVYVTSYETARMDSGVTKMQRKLLDLAPTAVVIDECHLIKNRSAQRSQNVRRLASATAKRGGAVVALSGTPITHHPGDLWPVLEALEPGAWPARERWVARYCDSVPTADYGEDILGLNGLREPEFRTTLLGQHRRVAKADVLTELPPKVYSTRVVDLPREWRKAYDEMESQMLAELPDGDELSVMGVLAQLTRLGQLAAAPADVHVTYGPEVDEDTGEPKVHTNVKLKPTSWKVAELLEIMAERPGEQVVCFAPSRQLIELAGAAATTAGYRVGYVMGGQTATDRTRYVEQFQAGELDLICVTTGAGGVGLTLTAARTVVFLQRPWSLVEAMQAEDRCHRIGAEGHTSIDVIDVIARNTLDSRVREVLRTRAGQLADFVQDPRVVSELLGGTHTTNHERQAS